MREEKEDIQTGKKKKVCGHRVVNTTMFSRVPEFRILEECTLVEPHLKKTRIYIYTEKTLMDCPKNG